VSGSRSTVLGFSNIKSIVTYSTNITRMLLVILVWLAQAALYDLTRHENTTSNMLS